MRNTENASLPRLKQLERQGKKILYLNFENASVEEMDKARHELFEMLRKGPSGIRLLINVKNISYTPQDVRAWKSELVLINEKVSRSALIGLSAVAHMALKGVRAYARLMGIEMKSAQAKPFDSEMKALDYLCND